MKAAGPYGFNARRLEGVSFGRVLRIGNASPARALARFEADPAALIDLFHAANGLLVIKGLGALRDDPELLLRLSRLLGPEVENYRETLTTGNFFHDSVDEILVLSNLPPCRFEPPPRPEPALTADGGIPTRYPHRSGWHTDQSYRRPPPDVSLLLGLVCPPRDQGQTLYADGISAYRSLPAAMKRRIAGLEGVHAMRGLGRTGPEVRDGAPLRRVRRNQLPQRQPLVRRHPLTGRQSLYLCDGGQMDFIDGPIAGLEPGADGAGARLLNALLDHLTQPGNVYAHEWDQGDLVIHDNRNMLHTPTWYDSAAHPRLMWRTTVMGHPGEEYAGEGRSWVAARGQTPMDGLEDLEF